MAKERESRANTAGDGEEKFDSSFVVVPDIGMTNTMEGEAAGKAFVAFMAHDNSKEEYYKYVWVN